MTDPRGRHVTLNKAEEPQDPDSMHHGGSFKKYMQFKNQKLREQFKGDVEEAEQPGTGRKLFAGICIHVNGFTNPSHQELRQIMAAHGGIFEVYYSKQRVTHIICSNLPNAKIKALEKERTSTPIVRPEWITDSLAAGRVLPHEDYVLWRLRDQPGQSTLFEFKPQPISRSSVFDQSPSKPTIHQPVAMTKQPPAVASMEQGQSLSVPAAADNYDRLLIPDKLLGVPGQPVRESEASMSFNHPNSGSLAEPEAAAIGQSPSPSKRPDSGAALDGNGRRSSLGSGWQNTQDQQDAGLTSPNRQLQRELGKGADLQRAQQVAAACRAACDMLKGAPKSSRDDPQFMDNYYKSSRLHFIGTWKARIEALAAQSSGSAPAPKATKQRAIVHLDMDCFFASVAALTDASLKGLPLAVCHSNSAQGTGEVSSANYEARALGIGAMMCIGEAKRLCPSLVVMPYQYDKYQAVSEQVYKILMKYTAAVQPLSCDEAFLDVSGLGDPEQIALSIREEIFRETGCTSSAGISHNLLLARIATKAGKPDGQFLLAADQVDKHLMPLKVDALPGVGWSTRQRLHRMGIHTVADLRESSQDVLQRELGAKNGSLLWAAAHGQDDRPVEPMKLRRSVGAEVNWGIRFTCEADADTFLDGLAGELHNRMIEAGVKGRCITIKLKRRKSNAPEPIKFLGHGPCDNMSRSVTLNRFTNSTADLAAESRALLRALRVPATQIRGIGISVSKLDNDAASNASGPGRGALPRAAPAIASAFRASSKAAVGNSELTKEDLVACGQSGIFPDRLALLPKSLQDLASPEKQLLDEHPVESRGHQQSVPSLWAFRRHAAGDVAAAQDVETKAMTDSQDRGLQDTTVEDQEPQQEQMGAAGSQSVGRNSGLSDDCSDLRNPPSPGCVYSGLQLGLSPGEQESSDGAGEAESLPNFPAAEEEPLVFERPVSSQAALPQVRMDASGISTPILALPPASQVDASVLDALPLQMRREFERAYGIGRFKSPPGRGKRKRGGGGRQPTLARSLRRQLVDLQAADKGLSLSELTPSRVDLEVLRELPLEVQQEVAADMARAQRLAAIRPLHQSSFAQLPAPDPPPAVAPDPRPELAAEHPRQLWPKLAAAVEDIEVDLQLRPPDVEKEGMDEQQRLGGDRLKRMGEVVLEYGRSLIRDDLEGLQFLLRQLSRTARRLPGVSAALLTWEQELQAAVSEQWQGCKIYCNKLL